MVKGLLTGRRILVTGGTGSLGKAFLHEVVSGKYGRPDLITVFSRDEAKQFYLMSELENDLTMNEHELYKARGHWIRFIVGDVRDYPSLRSAVRDHDLVVHAAALKQVPSCEIFPLEAMKTNCVGAGNVVRAVEEAGGVRKCVFISTDKAAKPTNAMGISKALQEKIFIAANQHTSGTAYVGVRYGNVIASRGSVVPTFVGLINENKPVPITDTRMTRFLLTLPQAVETMMAAIKHADAGEIIVPNAKSARVVDIVTAIAGNESYPTEIIGTRPGEKLHEIMIGFEELSNLRQVQSDNLLQQQFFAISPQLQFYHGSKKKILLESELSSKTNLLTTEEIKQILKKNGISVSSN